jgi:hypothetical protein
MFKEKTLPGLLLTTPANSRFNSKDDTLETGICNLMQIISIDS